MPTEKIQKKAVKNLTQLIKKQKGLEIFIDTKLGVYEAILHAGEVYVKIGRDYLTTYNADNDEKKYRENFAESRNFFSIVVKTLLDFAVGINFKSGELDFLKDIDVSDFNFIGVTVDGLTVTNELLGQLGAINPDKVLITLSQLEALSDKKRRKMLDKQLEAAITELDYAFGIIDEMGRVNVHSLAFSIQWHDEKRIVEILKSKRRTKEIKYDEEIGKGLIIAAQQGDDALVKLLSSHPMCGLWSILEAIKVAVENKHEQIADYLSSLKIVDGDGNTLLHKAIFYQNIEVITKLLQRGASVNQQNKMDETPLMIAANHFGRRGQQINRDCYASIIKLLLQHGADANQYSDISPLYRSVQAGSSEAVDLLLPLTHKQDVIIRSCHYDQDDTKQPWFVGLVFILFDMAERPDSNLDDDIKILTALRANGADFTILDQYRNEDRTTVLSQTMRPLIYIITETYQINNVLRKLRFLLKNGANPNMTDENGDTPIHDLADRRYWGKCIIDTVEDAYDQVLELLLSFGADIRAKNKKGLTAYEMATQNKNEKLAKILSDHGALLSESKKHTSSSVNELIRQRENMMGTQIAIKERQLSHAPVKLPKMR